MKKLFLAGFLALFTTTLLSLSSCKGDPSEHDIFIGKYEGFIGYGDLSDLEKLTLDKGTTTVSKVGKTYSFFFSTEKGNSVPSIVGVEFKKSDSESMTAIGLSGISAITIKNNKLDLLYTKGLGKVWKANGTKK